MNKQQRDELRKKADQDIVIYGTDVLELLDHIDALEGIITNLAAPIYSDEQIYELQICLRGSHWAVARLREFGQRAKAAIASAQEINGDTQ